MYGDETLSMISNIAMSTCWCSWSSEHSCSSSCIVKNDGFSYRSRVFKCCINLCSLVQLKFARSESMDRLHSSDIAPEDCRSLISVCKGSITFNSTSLLISNAIFLDNPSSLSHFKVIFRLESLASYWSIFLTWTWFSFSMCWHGNEKFLRFSDMFFSSCFTACSGCFKSSFGSSAVLFSLQDSTCFLRLLIDVNRRPHWRKHLYPSLGSCIRTTWRKYWSLDVHSQWHPLTWHIIMLRLCVECSVNGQNFRAIRVVQLGSVNNVS